MTCRQCGKAMNPVEVMLGPVCGACTRVNHQRAVAGIGPNRPRDARSSRKE